MQNIVEVFREFARLDLKRMGEGLSVAELERWSLVSERLERDLRKDEDAVARERRSARRIPTHLNCTYRSSRDLRDAAVTQLSTGGVFIATRRPLPIGTRMMLRIRIEDSGAAIEVAGSVVSNNVGPDLEPGRSGMGVRFTTVSPEMIEAISELYAREICRERIDTASEVAIDPGEGAAHGVG